MKFTEEKLEGVMNNYYVEIIDVSFTLPISLFGVVESTEEI